MSVIRHKVTLFVIAAAIVASGTAVALTLLDPPTKSEFKSSDPATPSFAEGSVINGTPTRRDEVLATTSQLTYESPAVSTNQPRANAVGIQWTQEGDTETSVEMRSFDGKTWTPWTPLGGAEDRPDDAPATHAALLLTKDSQQVQYRFALTGSEASPTSLSGVKLTAIDTTVGPDPTKQSATSKLFGSRAQAKVDGPRIISRTEWGCPEGESSPRWGPEYIIPDKIIVHHTAGEVAGSSASSVRAIWFYHANSQGWGDIGYNYLVDTGGAIFQGRHYDKGTAETNGWDVRGGHTLGQNQYSIGVATLGNFSSQGVTNPMLDSVGNIAAFKSSRFSFNPGAPGRLGGHRDYYSTACPGANLYAHLGTIRVAAHNYYERYYRQHLFDYSYVRQDVNGQGNVPINLRAGQTATLKLDIKNEGAQTWQNSGSNPVRLSTNHPLSHDSSLAHNWLSANRPATFTEKVNGSGVVSAASSIAPGEVARFTFQIKAPNVDIVNGRAYYIPVVEGAYYFVRDQGIHFPITVEANRYFYQWLEQDNGMPTTPKTNGTLSITFKNIGNVAWQKSGSNTVSLAPSRPNDRASNLGIPNRATTFDGKAQLASNGSVVHDGDGEVIYDSGATTIEPGEAGHFIFAVQTPAYPVVTREYFNLVAENITWMNDIGIYWDLNQPQNYHSQWQAQSAAPVIDKSNNPVGAIYFDYKNTGTYPWRKTDGIIKIAPSNPLDRSSLFAAIGLPSGDLPANTANWSSTNRVGAFSGKVTSGTFDSSATVINPGETARFHIALDASDVSAGVHREYFRIVAEGFAWLEDYGAYLDVIVQE